jgi:cold shock CspA family protein
MSNDDTTSNMPNAGNNSSDRLTGRVKWFNNRAGFGFVTVLEGEKKDEDVFVHHSGIVVNSEQYKYLVQGEYVSFALRESDNQEHPYQAGDVKGVFSGWLMCETRNENRSTRSEEGDGDEEDTRRRQPHRREGQGHSGRDRRTRSGRGVRPRGTGPRGAGGNDEWVLTRRNGGGSNSRNSRDQDA